MNYLIGYKDAERNFGHEDPMLTEYTYGESGANTDKLQKVQKGDFLFFHKTIHNKRYITAYYLVEEVVIVKDIKQNRLIMNKYDNPHLKKEIHQLTPSECIAFGNPIQSKALQVPLEITPELLSKLSRPANLNPNQSLLSAISSALRTWKELNPSDINLLLDLIEQNESKGRLTNRVLTAEEVFQILERDIEKFIISNPSILDVNYKIEKSQHIFSDESRLDLLLRDTTNNEFIVVEIKKGPIDRNALNQIKHYIKLCKKELKLNTVKGILVGSGIAPSFEDDINKAKRDGITVRNYGWGFTIN
ncbi:MULTISPECIES: endonuclease NucS domain-containing protein [Bacillus cereus group]|uniref:endonuclease NucS domain-containing protein n=1 Tax=Bacillus cereus group TaxID=86661 RepID=UPI001F587023|nr:MULTISPECIES: endonuclease NucS domain-containing protein [Bacillus cereus group]MED0827765.1 endonuclease NucS [Bacillus pacificus]